MAFWVITLWYLSQFVLDFYKNNKTDVRCRMKRQSPINEPCFHTVFYTTVTARLSAVTNSITWLTSFFCDWCIDYNNYLLMIKYTKTASNFYMSSYIHKTESFRFIQLIKSILPRYWFFFVYPLIRRYDRLMEYAGEYNVCFMLTPLTHSTFASCIFHDTGYWISRCTQDHNRL